MATDERLRQITIVGGRTVYINVLDIRSFYNYESKLIIEMIDGTVYEVNGAPNVVTFYNTVFTVTPTEITLTNNPINVQLLEPVTIDGTIAISSIGGTVATNTTITNNPLSTKEQLTSLTITQTVTALNAVSQTILVANANRKYLLIRNSSTSDAIIYIRLNATAATTTNSLLLRKGEYFEFPENMIYTGAITAISSAFGSDSVSVMEGI